MFKQHSFIFKQYSHFSAKNIIIIAIFQDLIFLAKNITVFAIFQDRNFNVTLANNLGGWTEMDGHEQTETQNF